ncbi:hypothetical protein LOK49_LG11G00419 [Camellia lanceoleosa]|uniref:Uncharacterized protein n=1 Tax=Camellia lanceoleosa TaxID=1840588 RepID=A0ACC0G1E6_9ERIC|nr:hypothetical protein LOK49_LG11G00419 [Camellia lanceoleosa]
MTTNQSSNYIASNKEGKIRPSYYSAYVSRTVKKKKKFLAQKSDNRGRRNRVYSEALFNGEEILSPSSFSSRSSVFPLSSESGLFQGEEIVSASPSLSRLSVFPLSLKRPPSSFSSTVQHIQEVQQQLDLTETKQNDVVAQTYAANGVSEYEGSGLNLDNTAGFCVDIDVGFVKLPRVGRRSEGKDRERGAVECRREGDVGHRSEEQRKRTSGVEVKKRNCRERTLEGQRKTSCRASD